MLNRLRRAWPLFGLLALSACAHVTNDSAALCQDAARPCYQPEAGYRFLPDKNAERDTLVIVTLSGGGIRASALGYGTLLALKELPGRAGAGSSLLDEVDIISSVSGGSVTAGWYGWKGQAGLVPGNALEQFFQGGGNAALAWRGLNPAAVAGYALTSYQRSDVLAGFFADRLFRDESGETVTFKALTGKYRNDPSQPFVILNATDLGHESRFPFTQGQFDLICSDLDAYSLAHAVAASANFPLVFSPIGLQNHSADCAVHVREPQAWAQQGPPRWINRYACYDGWIAADARARAKSGLRPVAGKASAAEIPSPRSNGLLELRWARSARDYIEPPAGDTVIHLLDGGLVDNLGVLSTLAIEDEAARPPGLFQRLNTHPLRPAADPGIQGTSPATRNAACPEHDPDAYAVRYKNIKEVLYIVVNARTRSAAGIDDSVYPPDLVSTALRVIDTPLDSTILDNQNYLTAELQAILQQPPETAAATGSYDCNSKPPLPPGVAPPVCARIISLDFEVISDSACRNRFWQIATTWTLDQRIIDALIELPRAMLRRSGELHDFYGDLDRIDSARSKGAPAPTTSPTHLAGFNAASSNFAADFAAPCKAVAAAAP
jgi:predicted acylesterase/phospholipase RssA